MGLSVSYDRVLDLQIQMDSSLCQHINEIGLVCPYHLKYGLFTVGAIDNLDHNLSSTTAKDSFHGTGISLFQFPTKLNPGTPQEIASLLPVTASSKLPVSYTIVPAIVLKKESVAVPTSSASVSFGRASELMKEAVLIEQNWLEHAVKVMAQNVIDREDSVTWAAYHASRCDADNYCPTLTQLMPLF